MSLPPPSYVPIALLKDMEVVHRWDDWDPYVLLGTQDPKTQASLARITDRAQIAFAIACAEWVVYRFKNLFDDRRPYDFLEASWASEMSSDYAVPPQLAEDEWKGPIRAPIDLALVTIINTFYTTEDGAGNSDAAFAELIPLHVLNDRMPFLRWRDSVLVRLQTIFPREPSDVNGPPVPPEAMDPNVELDGQALNESVSRFLHQLDERTNLFISKVKRSG